MKIRIEDSEAIEIINGEPQYACNVYAESDPDGVWISMEEHNQALELLAECAGLLFALDGSVPVERKRRKKLILDIQKRITKFSIQKEG